MQRVTLAIPHWNRFCLLMECFKDVKDDPRIGQIVISDDHSMDGSWEMIEEMAKDEPKIMAFRNSRNVDCHFNKKLAVQRCAEGSWVILFDDDNVIDPSYLDALFAASTWDKNVVYCPEWARPHFDYRKFSGRNFTKEFAAIHSKDQTWLTMLNTCNYVVQREAYLDVWDGTVNPHTADSIYQNCRWLESGRSIYVVPGMQYFHRVHDKSHFKTNIHKTGGFAKEVENKLRALR